MSFKIYLLKKAIIELQEQAQEYKEKSLCGSISVTLNFFKGGLTSKKLLKEVTEK